MNRFIQAQIRRVLRKLVRPRISSNSSDAGSDLDTHTVGLHESPSLLLPPQATYEALGYLAIEKDLGANLVQFTIALKMRLLPHGLLCQQDYRMWAHTATGFPGALVFWPHDWLRTVYTFHFHISNVAQPCCRSMRE